MSLTAEGPNLWPGLKLAPVSNGIPTIAASAPLASATVGSRMKDRIPVKRGFCVASGIEEPVTVNPLPESRAFVSLNDIYRCTPRGSKCASDPHMSRIEFGEDAAS
jgi:hypothetical protein